MRVRVQLGAGHRVDLNGIIAGVIADSLRRRRGKSGGLPDGAPCPVTPDRPLNLSGGAAAPLEFDV